ncbi:hypothetical protein K504DRAFT_158440 [Pleomassaria siparia CBS 279.74]|uniref:Uncharacterized protein n=1 Tax=Pleomassaria siparia CBS 279.74 TaxID=1314801 RepID=A0A6G1JUA5_9PLEO|nr:hypothetical protein K504DRAFT_158440 [Pleomassaria siparia CBS 279.74]
MRIECGGWIDKNRMTVAITVTLADLIKSSLSAGFRLVHGYLLGRVIVPAFAPAIPIVYSSWLRPYRASILPWGASEWA